MSTILSSIKYASFEAILSKLKGGDNMNVNLEKVSEAQAVADKLAELPKEALLYIAGYTEGVRDKPNRKRRKAEKTNGEKEARP
nr:MAG TPA: hypothetical protein [Caudoviricetes sp.]